MRVYRPKFRDKDGVQQESRVYWTQFSLRGRLFRRSLGTRDKGVAEQLARRLLDREERRAAGLLDPAEEQQARPLSDHLTDFESTLRSRGASESHLRDRMGCLREFVAATRAAWLKDVESARVARWLTDLKGSGLAARSVNRRLQAVRQFARWCVGARRMAYDALVGLKPLNEAADRRHVRRALAPDELQRLLDAAERRPLEDATAYRKHRGVTPEQRVKLLALGRVRRLVYALAAGTGLRRGELQRLTWGDLDLEKRLIRIPAASSKSRKDQSLPLRSDLAEALAAHRPEGAGAKDRVVPAVQFPNLRTLKRDLVAAGLARAERAAGGTLEFDLTDESGRALDFHALRMTAITGWVASGAHPRVVQALARHAKIETTMAVYTDVTLLDLRGAVEGAGPIGTLVVKKTLSDSPRLLARIEAP